TNLSILELQENLPDWLSLEEKEEWYSELYFENNFSVTNLDFDSYGNLYVSSSEDDKGRILKILPNGKERLILNDPYFKGIFSTTFDKEDNLYFSVYNTIHAIFKMSPDRNLTNLITTSGSITPSIDGNLNVATVQMPTSLLIKDDYLYFSEKLSNDIRRIDFNSSTVETPYINQNYYFQIIENIKLDKDGNFVLSNKNRSSIEKINKDGEISKIVGGSYGFADGDSSIAQLKSPSGFDFDKNWNIFVADTNNGRVRKITPNGDVTTIAGDGVLDVYDTQNLTGWGKDISLTSPAGLAIDKSGNIFVGNQRECLNNLYAISKLSKIKRYIISGKPTQDNVGLHEFSFKVSDGEKEKAVDFNITVIDLPFPPVLEFGGEKSVSIEANSTSTFLDFNATDRDTTTNFTFSLSGTDSEFFQIDPLSGEISLNEKLSTYKKIDNDGNGVYELNVTVADNSEADLSETIEFKFVLRDLVINKEDFNISISVLDSSGEKDSDFDGIVYLTLDGLGKLDGNLSAKVKKGDANFTVSYSRSDYFEDFNVSFSATDGADLNVSKLEFTTVGHLHSIDSKDKVTVYDNKYFYYDFNISDLDGASSYEFKELNNSLPSWLEIHKFDETNIETNQKTFFTADSTKQYEIGSIAIDPVTENIFSATPFWIMSNGAYTYKILKVSEHGEEIFSKDISHGSEIYNLYAYNDRIIFDGADGIYEISSDFESISQIHHGEVLKGFSKDDKVYFIDKSDNKTLVFDWSNSAIEELSTGSENIEFEIIAFGFDSIGNLFIRTEFNSIEKIDTNEDVSTFLQYSNLLDGYNLFGNVKEFYIDKEDQIFVIHGYYDEHDRKLIYGLTQINSDYATRIGSFSIDKVGNSSDSTYYNLDIDKKTFYFADVYNLNKIDFSIKEESKAFLYGTPIQSDIGEHNLSFAIFDKEFSVEENITINVIDNDDTSLVLTTSTFRVPEGKENLFLTPEPIDLNGKPITSFEVVGNNQDLFSISDNNELLISKAFYYTNTISLTLDVAISNGEESVIKQINLIVEEDFSLSTPRFNSVDENTIFSSEIDFDAENYINYKVSFCGGKDDHLFGIYGQTLKSLQPLQYENNNNGNYSVCLRYEDEYGYIFETNSTVMVKNIDEFGCRTFDFDTPEDWESFWTVEGNNYTPQVVDGKLRLTEYANDQYGSISSNFRLYSSYDFNNPEKDFNESIEFQANIGDGGADWLGVQLRDNFGEEAIGVYLDKFGSLNDGNEDSIILKHYGETIYSTYNQNLGNSNDTWKLEIRNRYIVSDSQAYNAREIIFYRNNVEVFSEDIDNISYFLENSHITFSAKTGGANNL
ncbi:Cadherin domain-containing protein, partial [Thiovulum sp. ES]